MLIPAYKRGFRIIFLIGAALAAFAFCLAFVLMPQVGLKREDDEKLKAEGKMRMEGEIGHGDVEGGRNQVPDEDQGQGQEQSGIQKREEGVGTGNKGSSAMEEKSK